MGANFRVVFGFVGAFQNSQGCYFVAHAVLNPAQAVGDHRVVGGKFQGGDDQFTCFFQADVAISQGKSQGVVSVVEIGLGLDHAFQQALHFIHAVELFSHHGHFVTQLQILWRLFAGRLQYLVGLLKHLVVAQQFHFRLQTGALGLRCVVGQLLNQGAGLGDVASAGQQVGPLNLHLRQGIGVVDFVQPGFGFAVLFLPHGDLRQHQIGL